MTEITVRTAARHGRREESRTRLTRNVAPGIHRLQHAFVNCYIVEDGDRLTIVDCALPETWPYLVRALDVIGRSPADIAAVVLTHAHFDHLGFARRLQSEWNTPVFAHQAEEYIAKHPYRYAHENSRLLYPVRHPGSIPVLTQMAKAGALRVPGISGLTFFEPGQILDVPGDPVAVFSPGHTFGHCALFFPERKALLTGDALVTLDPYTGAVGPQIVSGAATADSSTALESLSSFEQLDVTIVLPGHGQPWRGGIDEAVARARTAGPS
jgi:glyoxylase-like metal-dependent hydrolase (beta-lactamase superfamily II)